MSLQFAFALAAAALSALHLLRDLLPRRRTRALATAQARPAACGACARCPSLP